MIRNLLYSICLHLFIVLILYTNNTVLYKSKNTLDLNVTSIDNKITNDNNNTKSIYNLTRKERVNIQKQIKKCYKNAILKTKKTTNLAMSVQVSLSRNGEINMDTINFNLINETDLKNINKDDYNKTIDNIKLALLYCNPLKNLPYQKYNIWKNMNLLFNNN